MAIRTYGPDAVDWEARVDFDRLRRSSSQLVDTRRHPINSRKDHVECLSVEDGALFGSNEQIFEPMRDLGDIRQAQHLRRALDAVGFAHRLGNRVDRVGCLFEP